jgi:hypothetical protein
VLVFDGVNENPEFFRFRELNSPRGPSRLLDGGRQEKWCTGKHDQNRQQSSICYGSGDRLMSRTAATLVTATDIAHWAQYYHGRFSLPQLIRRLILASVKDVQQIRIPSEEQVSRPGFDGLLEVTRENPWVPAGLSVWEMGVDASPKGKADEDYNKRTKKPDTRRRNATFVFVTPRTWQKREDWRKAKYRRKEWKDVRVLDCSDLAEWLDSTHSVARWFARLIGKCPPDARDVSGYWESISHSSQPNLPATALLAGREGTVAELNDWIKNPASPAYIECDSAPEMIDFFAAYAVSRDPDCRSAEARALIVETKDAWHTLTGSTSPLILVPTFSADPQLVTEAVRSDHHVLCHVSPSVRTHGNLKLRRLVPHELEITLKDNGFDSQRAKRLAREAGGSSTVLKRLIVTGAPRTPPWAQPNIAPKLAPFLLVGGWCPDSEEDRRAVSAITRLTEAEVHAVALEWSRSDDPLFRKADNEWRLISRVDSWRWLHGYLAQQSANVYSKVFPKVVAINDPRFDLPPDKRILASILGKRAAHSRALRHGMVEAFAFLSISADLPSEYPPIAVRVPLYLLFMRVFGKRMTWKRLASLQASLQLFAEAMPDCFLDALERGIQKQPSSFIELFKQEHFFGGTPSLGLIWALEVLAWDSNYTFRVALILAKLSVLDPGGNMHPRPFGTLGSLFFPRLPQTTASTDQRIEMLDELARKEPEVAWKLLLSLLPKSHGIATYNVHPRFRNWSTGWVTSARVGAGVQDEFDRIAARILKLGKNNPQRLIQLLEHITNFSTPSRTALLEALGSIRSTQFTDAERLNVTQALRKCVARHHRFGQWSLPKKDVRELSRILKIIEPKDPMASSLWLFENWPELAMKRQLSFEKKKAVIDQRRREAIKQILRARGFSGLKLLAEQASEPYHVGYLASQQLLKGADKVISELLVSSNVKLVLFAQGLARGTLDRRGWSWAKKRIQKKSTPHQVASFGLALSFAPETWDAMLQHSAKTETLYWTRSRGYNSQLQLGDYERAVRKWHEVKTPNPALDVLSFILDKHKPDPVLVMETLELLLTSDEGTLREEQAQSGSRVSKLVEYLQESSGLDRRRLMMLEWNYLNWLLHTRTEPKTLLESLSKQPLFFVDIVSLMYKPREGRGRKAPSELQKLKAEKADRLLDELRSIPGTCTDGSIDENVLRTWIDTVRGEAGKRKIKEPAEFKIGEILSVAPEDLNATWPCEAVRNVIEDLRNEHIERGIAQERFNRFQPNSIRREIAEKSWSDLAKKYRDHAKAVATRWPRTAGILRGLADSCERSARRHQQQMEAI